MTGRDGTFDFEVREGALLTAGGFLPEGLVAAGFAFFGAGLFAPAFAAGFRVAFALLGTGLTDFFLEAGAAGFCAAFVADLRTGFSELRFFFARFPLLPEAFTVLGATNASSILPVNRASSPTSMSGDDS